MVRLSGLQGAGSACRYQALIGPNQATGLAGGFDSGIILSLRMDDSLLFDEDSTRDELEDGLIMLAQFHADVQGDSLGNTVYGSAINTIVKQKA